MKNHLIIWIDQGKDIVDIPFWGDLIKNGNLKAQRFFPEIASLFRKHNIPVLYSKEYKPKLQQWSADEAEVYRMKRLSGTRGRKASPSLPHLEMTAHAIFIIRERFPV